MARRNPYGSGGSGKFRNAWKNEGGIRIDFGGFGWEWWTNGIAELDTVEVGAGVKVVSVKGVSDAEEIMSLLVGVDDLHRSPP